MARKFRPLAVVESAPAAPVRQRSKFEKLTSLADDMARSADYALNEFRTSFEKDPANAFEWSSRAFQAAAEKEAALIMQRELTFQPEDGRVVSEEERVNWILDYALGVALREARNPSHSTSIQSNEMSRAKASAWAKVYDKVERGTF